MVRCLLVFGLFGASDAGHWPSPPRSIYDVLRFCNEHPKAFGHYFEPGQLKMPFPRRDAGEDDSFDRVASTRCSAGAILAAYNEPQLTKPLVDEAYRVVWTPSFAPPLVIRISRSVGGSYSATLKRDVAEGETLTGHFTEVIREISPSDFESVRAAAERAGCWSEGNTCHAELSNRLYSSNGEVMVIADGESWLLEGSGRGEHWAVQVDTPAGGPFMEVCRAIAKAAHAEEQKVVGGWLYQWKSRETPDGGL